MNQQEIFNYMNAPGDWHEDAGSVYNNTITNSTLLLMRSGHIGDMQSRANAEAIVSAVNNTYGMGINPEKVKALYLNLESALSMIKRLDSERPDPGYETAFDQNVISEINRIEMVLNSTKL